MTDAQTKKERMHLLIWGVSMVLLVSYVEDIIGYWALLSIPIFIIGSFITSGAFRGD